MSQTKNTLLLILKQQIVDLHQGVMEMDEDSLIKQVAKQKVIYNLTRHQNVIELVYSYVALCQYYISKELYEPAVKNLMESLEAQQTGDIYYQLGVCFYKLKKISQAIKMLEKCLVTEWIEPSVEHQLTSQLEALNYLQLIYYEKANANPERKNLAQDKLVNLSYEKIKLTKKFDANKNNQRGQNYYYSLAMADLAQIYANLGDHLMALQKINTAISMFEGERDSVGKLGQFYLLCAKMNEKLGRQFESRQAVEKGVVFIQMKEPGQKLTQYQQQLYYLMIRKNLGV